MSRFIHVTISVALTTLTGGIALANSNCKLKKPIFVGYAKPTERQILLQNVRLNQAPKFGWMGACKARGPYNLRLFNVAKSKSPTDWNLIPSGAVGAEISSPESPIRKRIGFAVDGYMHDFNPVVKNTEVPGSNQEMISPAKEARFRTEYHPTPKSQLENVELEVLLEDGYITSIELLADVPNFQNPWNCWGVMNRVPSTQQQRLCVLGASSVVVSQGYLTQPHENDFKNPLLAPGAKIQSPTISKKRMGLCEQQARGAALEHFTARLTPREQAHAIPLFTRIASTKDMPDLMSPEAFELTVSDRNFGTISYAVEGTIRQGRFTQECSLGAIRVISHTK